MAQVVPHLDILGTDTHRGERDTLEWLADALPDDYWIFYSWEWQQNYRNVTQLGELDFVILAPNGRVAVIEQKNGALRQDDKGHWVKDYDSYKGKNPLDQLRRSRINLEQLWRQSHSSRFQTLLILLLPDHRIDNVSDSGLDDDTVFHAGNIKSFPERIQNLLLDNPKDAPNDFDTKHEFFCRELEVSLDVGALMNRQKKFYKRMDTGLIRTLKQLQLNPYKLLIEGPAGCGKSQVSIDVYHWALEQGLKPLYLCFNRPLADAMVEQLSKGGMVSNIDHFVDVISREEMIYDPAEPFSDWLPRLRQLLVTQHIDESEQYDWLIIDEAMDFCEDRYACALHFLKPGGRLLVMRDPRQNLYQKGFDFEPAATLVLEHNYRCSKGISDFTSQLLNQQVEQAAGIIGRGQPQLNVYQSDKQQLQQVEAAIRSYLQLGYAIGDIALISGKGMGKSYLNTIDTVASYDLIKYTGRYTADGDQIYSQGELVFDNIYRFKGRQKPVVILAELDFDSWNDRVEALVYTGCTRAQLELTVLISEGFGEVILNRQ